MATTRLTQALEDLYAAFAAHRKPQRIEACPCCVDSKEVCTLLNTPLRSLTPDQLSGYASSVFLTAGSQADFRYFLPRMLDISLDDPSWWPDRECLLGKLTIANWKTWSSDQRQSLIHLFDAAFNEALLHEDAGWEIDSWICALSMAGLDVVPYLEKLKAPAAEKALLQFFEVNAGSLPKGRLTNAFWEDEKANPAPVIAWLNSRDVQATVWPHYGAG